MEFDGIQLEASVFLTHINLRSYIISFIRELGILLHGNSTKLITSIYLQREINKPFLETELFSLLDPFVDYFILFSYEFGLNYLHAPILWTMNALNTIGNETHIDPKKIIVGVPLYGHAFTASGPISKMGIDSLRFLDTKDPPYVTWEAEAEEHTVMYRQYKDKEFEVITLVLPTPYVIKFLVIAL